MNRNILIGIVVILVLVAGFLFFESNRPSMQIPEGDFVPVPVSQDTNDWKTFNSIRDGNYKSGYLFILRYPPTWYLETLRTKEGNADDQSTQFSDYTISRGEEYTLKPGPKEHCDVYVVVDYSGRYMDTSKQPSFNSNNSYTDPAKKANCDSTIQHIKESISAEFSPQ